MSQRGYLKSWQGQYFQRRPKSPERRHWKVEILLSLSTGQISFQVLCRGEPDYLELSLRFRIFSKPDQNGIVFLFFIKARTKKNCQKSANVALTLWTPWNAYGSDALCWPNVGTCCIIASLMDNINSGPRYLLCTYTHVRYGRGQLKPDL